MHTYAELEIMGIEEVEVGMMGKGYTVLKSPEISEFDAEILGTYENALGPGHDVIIAKLTSPDINDAGGVISGMSGSPVYIKGKLIGAVAYSFMSFSKENIEALK